MKKISLIAIATFLGIFSSYAQEEVNPITTAAPFLLIAPDARAGGLTPPPIPAARRPAASDRVPDGGHN